MTPLTPDYCDSLRAQLRALRRCMDRRDVRQREAERLLTAMVKLMTESVGVVAQQERLAHRAQEIIEEMARLSDRLQALGLAQAAAPERMQ